MADCKHDKIERFEFEKEDYWYCKDCKCIVHPVYVNDKVINNTIDLWAEAKKRFEGLVKGK